MTPDVILVSEQDESIGTCGKLEAHERGLLHRAVSVFVFDDLGRLLVQQRARGKYHSGGLWSNSACTHPRAGESLEDAVRRAVREELGATLDRLQYAFAFIYRADVGPGLVEHEYDHVFSGRLAGGVAPVPSEVAATAWRSRADLLDAIDREPATFTPWFRLLAPRILA